MNSYVPRMNQTWAKSARHCFLTNQACVEFARLPASSTLTPTPESINMLLKQRACKRFRQHAKLDARPRKHVHDAEATCLPAFSTMVMPVDFCKAVWESTHVKSLIS